MYSLKTFRVACRDLRVDSPEEALPVVTVPDILKPAFVGLCHVPLYYFDYISCVGPSWRAEDRVAVVTSEQLAVCELDGGVRVCVELQDVLEVVVDQSEPKRPSSFLQRQKKTSAGLQKKYTRLYVKTTTGNLLLRVVRDTAALLRALVSFGAEVNVRVLDSASRFESVVETESLYEPEVALFRTPARSYISDTGLVERMLMCERESSMVHLKHKSSSVDLRKLGVADSPPRRRAPSSATSWAQRSSSSGEDIFDASELSSPSRSQRSTQRVSFQDGTVNRNRSPRLKASGRQNNVGKGSPSGLRPALKRSPRVAAAHSVLEYHFPPMCESDCGSDVDASSLPLESPQALRYARRMGASILQKACAAASSPRVVRYETNSSDDSEGVGAVVVANLPNEPVTDPAVTP